MAALQIMIKASFDWKRKSPIYGKLPNTKDFFTGSRSRSSTFPTYLQKDAGDNAYRNIYLLPLAALAANQKINVVKPTFDVSTVPSMLTETIPLPKDAHEIISTTTNYANSTTTLETMDNLGPSASISVQDVQAFMKQPLSEFVKFDEYVTFQPLQSNNHCPNKPPYDLSGHVDAETVVAKQTRQRIQDDCQVYADKQNSKKKKRLCGDHTRINVGIRTTTR